MEREYQQVVTTAGSPSLLHYRLMKVGYSDIAAIGGVGRNDSTQPEVDMVRNDELAKSGSTFYAGRKAEMRETVLSPRLGHWQLQVLF